MFENIPHNAEIFARDRSRISPLGKEFIILSSGTSAGDYQNALSSFEQALRLRINIFDRVGEAATLNNLGNIYFVLKDYPKALEIGLQALQKANLASDRPTKIRILANLASIYRAQGKLPEALAKVNEAVDVAESLRSELTNDSFKTSYFASVQDFYQLKIDLLMQLHRQDPMKRYDIQAIETADQSRARVLRELLIQSNVSIRHDLPMEIRKKEEIIRRNIDALEIGIITIASTPEFTIASIPDLPSFSSADQKMKLLTRLNESLVIAYTAFDDLKNSIRKASPAYANLEYPKPITLKEIQQQLDPDTLILQYSLGQDQSYLWVISQTNLKTYILPKRADIEKNVQSFQKELEFTAPNSASTLSQQILAPATTQLSNKRLIIIPDGILHTVPFAALNTPNSKTYQPLISQNEITYLPSASTIAILRSTVASKPRAPKKLAILADPIFSKTDPRFTGKSLQSHPNSDLGEQIVRKRTDRYLKLTPLPHTKTEAEGILKLIPNTHDHTSAFEFDASYDWITDPKISQYRYVHLATHGFFDNDRPILSSIVLSSIDAQGRDRKAFLRFPDLFNLNLPTELVMLSACQTGLGNNVPGEGIIGMTRGFMYAGALRVGVSLWSVDDQATAALMQNFYQNLWQGKQSHAAALRSAQLTMWKQGKAPYYWAPFTLQGEWRN